MKKVRLSVLLMLLLVVTGCGNVFKVTQKEPKNKEVVVKKTEMSTLFIHGYKGSSYSLGGMMTRLEKQGVADKEMTIRVTPEGQVEKEGELTQEATNPMIQVLFEDNEKDEWTQSLWLQRILVTLAQEEQVTSVNVVGHSMGGVSTLRYLMSGDIEGAAKVNQLIAIGSPFNEFVETRSMEQLKTEMLEGPEELSDRMEDIEASVKDIPSTVRMALIGGQLSDTDLSDGTVPVGSAVAINAGLKKNGNKVSSYILTGENVDHSGLHENKQVDEIVINELWK